MREAAPGISGRMVFLFAAACGLSAANLYYAQPVLVNIARSLHTTPGTASLLVTCAQVGYATGLALLVPLGDLLPRRLLIPGVLTATAAALAVAAAAPALAPLAAVTVVFGLGSVAAQMIVPLAASLAPEERRGHVVGMVMSGLLLGILLARTASGLIANALSWRATYLIAAALTLVLAALLWRAVPPESDRPKLSYAALLASTIRLMRNEPILRRRSLHGGLNFAAFSLFWTTITFHLAAAPFHYSAGTIGLFGLVGAAGAVVANFAGRWADRDLHHLTSGVFVACVIASFAVFWIVPDNLGALLAAIVVFDIGIQGAQITNQAIIYRLQPEQRSRINAGYMVSYFIGGALGSALGGAVYSASGWSGVCALGVALGLVAAATAGWDASRARHTTAQLAVAD